ncbi:unnamed protein product [Linum trigynum]|uniref:RNase H type-1 domain-containing protein n=1 Tax=Linum trigynum TaxID=586398 RepID=A0AAV2FQK9_9ROSI
MEHLFLDCPVARALWGLSRLEYLGEGLPRHTFPLFLKRLMALIQQPPLFMAVVAVLWRIWRSRNWVVFEGKQFGFPALMRQFSQQYEEWVGLPVEVPSMPPPPTVPRSDGPGQAAGFTCQWDGATRKGSHPAGGMVLLSSSGDVLMAQGIQISGIDDPVVVELLVLREAIAWCLGQGFSGIRFEGDAKIIIDKINCQDARNSRLGAVLEEVLHFFCD